ncbi:MAG: MarR family transcriptional regulator [Hyphomonadaceae bacterium]|nr:MarR family transcriptional regulator [Hyphomonadaceae bacterium]
MANTEENTGSGPTLSLSDFLPYRLSVLSNTISSSIAARYQSAFGLTIWQWRVMAVLGETPGLTASQVAARTAMDKVAVSRAVAGLEDVGRLQRVRDESDGRAARLNLTPEGQAVYSQIVPIALASERDLLAGLSADERGALGELLVKLAGAASPDTPLW